jgi:8-amino-7-oxononanoate synthase
MTVVDLASFGYLGLLHAYTELTPWSRLSTGRPAAVGGDSLEKAIVPRLAEMQACEAATVYRSTLHVFRDLFACVSDEDSVIFLDEGSYPIAQWGVEWARRRGVPVRVFPHHDSGALETLLDQCSGDQRRPVVVVDGVSSRTWAPAPLAEYVMRVEERDGLVVVDDTHAVGLLGRDASPDAPFGYGGGGSLAWHAIQSPNVVLIGSLSKAFGVPVAVLSGSAETVAGFEGNSLTRIHCSPPTVPELLAVERSLDVNASHGDALRDQLTRNILHWRNIFHEAGFASADPIYPVQVVRLPRMIDPSHLDEELRARGVNVFVERGHEGVRVLVVITAALSETEIEFAAQALLDALEEIAGKSLWM